MLKLGHMLLMIHNDLLDEVMELTEGVGERIGKVDLVIRLCEGVLECQHEVLLPTDSPEDRLCNTIDI